MSETRQQRAHPRVPIGYRVKVVTDDALITFASARNISLGGLLLEPTPALPLACTCGVAIFLMEHEAGKRIVARGIVVRSDGGGTAIRFTKELDATSRDHLEALLDSMDAIQAGDAAMDACG